MKAINLTLLLNPGRANSALRLNRLDSQFFIEHKLISEMDRNVFQFPVQAVMEENRHVKPFHRLAMALNRSDLIHFHSQLIHQISKFIFIFHRGWFAGIMSTSVT